MTWFVNICAIITIVLNTAMWLCIILWLVSLIVRRCLKARPAGEESSRGALREKIVKWSEKTWGIYALRFFGGSLFADCIYLFAAVSLAGLISSKAATENYQLPATVENPPVNISLQMDEDIFPNQIPAWGTPGAAYIVVYPEDLA